MAPNEGTLEGRATAQGRQLTESVAELFRADLQQHIAAGPHTQAGYTQALEVENQKLHGQGFANIDIVGTTTEGGMITANRSNHHMERHLWEAHSAEQTRQPQVRPDADNGSRPHWPRDMTLQPERQTESKERLQPTGSSEPVPFKTLSGELKTALENYENDPKAFEKFKADLQQTCSSLNNNRETEELLHDLQKSLPDGQMLTFSQRPHFLHNGGYNPDPGFSLEISTPSKTGYQQALKFEVGAGSDVLSPNGHRKSYEYHLGTFSESIPVRITD